MPRYVIDPTKELHQIGSILEAFPFQSKFFLKNFQLFEGHCFYRAFLSCTDSTEIEYEQQTALIKNIHIPCV